jgi:dihydropteroate synthase
MAPLVMGVVNVTPDSFSDGGRFLDADAAIAHGLRLVEEGADVVDVGGESTRPGAEPVSESVERERVLPVVRALASQVRVSIDTTKAGVAEAAISAGATLVNDISSTLSAVAAAHGVGWVAMHMQGTPRTMQRHPSYDNVVAEVRDFLRTKAHEAVDAGVGEVWIDPGIGFGKTAAHNLSLLAHLDALVDDGFPVLVGLSRKSFLARVTGDAPPEDRLEPSLAGAVWAMSQGVAMVRVHDVRATCEAAALVGNPAATQAKATTEGSRS